MLTLPAQAPTPPGKVPICGTISRKMRLFVRYCWNPGRLPAYHPGQVGTDAALEEDHDRARSQGPALQLVLPDPGPGSGGHWLAGDLRAPVLWPGMPGGLAPLVESKERMSYDLG